MSMQKAQCRFHRIANRTACESSWSDEMIFFQWYEVMEKCTLPVNAIDAVLRCVRPGRQRPTGLFGEISIAVGYRLVAFDSARICVRSYGETLRTKFQLE